MCMWWNHIALDNSCYVINAETGGAMEWSCIFTHSLPLRWYFSASLALFSKLPAFVSSQSQYNLRNSRSSRLSGTSFAHLSSFVLPSTCILWSTLPSAVVLTNSLPAFCRLPDHYYTSDINSFNWFALLDFLCQPCLYVLICWCFVPILSSLFRSFFITMAPQGSDKIIKFFCYPSNYLPGKTGVDQIVSQGVCGLQFHHGCAKLLATTVHQSSV